MGEFSEKLKANLLGSIRAKEAMMESPEFFSDKAYRKIVKTPIDFTVSTMRQLGIGSIFIDTL